MKLRNWVTLGAISLGAVAAGVGIKSLMPVHFDTTTWEAVKSEALDRAALPNIDVTFLRCGSVTVPEFIATRGSFSLTPRLISHSAVLIRHPKATFLYDTGLGTDIYLSIKGQSLFFRKTLANFVFERSLSSHLQEQGLAPGALDFVLLSHLHWDHVSGVSDLPRVPLRVNRVEYDAARLELLDRGHGLVRNLMGDNPLELFDCDGPSYEGFRSSYDVFGDGSIILVPLPGHTAGNTGMFINRANGSRLLLVGDAAWVSENYLRPAPMHPFIWSRVTSDDATARQTLIDLYHLARRYPAMPLIAMHDAQMQESFMQVEQSRIAQVLR